MGATLGDAMGSATEQHQIDEIIDFYSGLLDRLVPPPIDTFSHNEFAGLVTGDSSQMFALTEALIETDGELDDATWLRAMLHRSQTSPLRHHMGPTTRLLYPRGASQVDEPRCLHTLIRLTQPRY